MYIFSTMEIPGLLDLCRPAMLYFLLSITAVIVIVLQNIGSGYQYCVGTQTCNSHPSLTTGIFIIKLLYILVWTWIINVLCKNGFEPIAWLLVFIPILLMFIFMALFISNTFDFNQLIPSINIFN